MTAEEKKIQVERFFAQKRESYFQLILANILQNEAVTHETLVTIKGEDMTEHRQANLIDIVDFALDAADYALEKLFPLPKEDKE